MIDYCFPMMVFNLKATVLSLLVFVIVVFPNATSFQLKSMPNSVSIERVRIPSTRVWMGRSLEEQKLSKKELFRRIRDDVNKAAAEPGFLDQENEPDVELYCKSDRSGLQNGDCPYSQFIQMVLLKKGVTYVIKPVSPVKLPSWIEKDHRGELPVLVHEGRAMTGPMAIAEYIDQKYPQKSLTRQGVCSYQEALEKTRNFFPTVTSYVLNKDGLKDAPLKDAVIRELNAIEKLLITTPGRFLCGVEMTLADLFLLPQLFHAMVAMEHFKDFESIVVDGDSPRPVLDNYVDKMLDLKEFNHKKAYCGVDKVIFGWKVARGEASFHFRT